MDDDDEFGDIYTDVLRPFTVSHPSILSSSSINSSKPDLNLQSDDEDILLAASDRNSTIPSTITHQTLIPKVEKPEFEITITHGESSSIKPNSNDGDRLVEVKKEKVDVVDGVRVLESQNGEVGVVGGGGAMVSEELKSSENFEIEDVRVENSAVNEGFNDKGGVLIKKEIEKNVENDDLGSESIIPGLSGGSFIPGVFGGGDNQEDRKDSRREDIGGSGGGGRDEDRGGDDWDSDSEDDLQIVLNDKSGPLGMDRNEGMGSDDEDGEDLVIVADGDQLHQPMEELEWGDDPTQAADGERKEAGDVSKVNGGMVNTAGTRIGYSNHVMYASHHSQFKYVRPGAAVVPGGAVGPGGAPGQVRPLVNMGPVGRGRGDWRPMGIKSAPGMQRPFHSGFGLPAWGNNSAGRGFGSGLEFTLPSHKTVFDIDIDSFEEKPWRNTGIDLSDFFNFGLDEENWKDYCKQLEQLRLEATMQSRIRVYESGRSEQDYDPDLPPELAAAAGFQDASAENAHLAKTEGVISDLTGQGRGAPRTIPTGRAIQVEGGFGERLPSIDTRPPRLRDSDAIIEIVLQGSGDDDPMTGNDADIDAPTDDLPGGDDEEDAGQTEYFDRPSQPYSRRKREIVGRREDYMGSDNNLHEADGVLTFPPEASHEYNPGSKGRAPIYPGGAFGTPQSERWPPEPSSDRYSRRTSERGNDVIPCESANGNKICASMRKKSGRKINGEQNLEATSPVSVEVVREASGEHEGDLPNELAVGESIVALEGEEIDKDVIIPSDNIQEGSPIPFGKRQKLNSQVEPSTAQDVGSVDSLRATRSSDNSKARSGSSRDYQKRRDGGEEEVVQEGRSRRMEDMKRRRDVDNPNIQRKDDQGRDGRQEMDRGHVYAKGRDDSQVSYPYRDWDLSQTHLSRVKTGDIERPRERDSSVGARQGRDDDTHARRLRDEEKRKRDHVDEIGYRHRSKVRESEKFAKDEHLHSRKRLDNGDWRDYHDKDMGLRQREKDENLMMRHDIFDDSHTRRRKEEEHLRREQTDKEVLHGYRAREDISRTKRERDDGLDPRKREDHIRVRDKPDENHSVRHREESWRQRERDERRLKQPLEDMLSKREREGRNSIRGGRDLEDKSWVGSVREKDELKGMVSDKDYPYKDKRRPTEHSKRSNRVEVDTFPQHRGRENVYARENQFINEDRNPRHERSSAHSDQPANASDSQLMHKERHRDSRRSKESDRTDQNTLGSSKRKQEDHNAHRNEKVRSIELLE
ncbi:Fip1 [Thalictrum thalictroides]|uniref:Fip1 n=1 Tax=Thalictrum thalictroides TaxID=46969 RepID=A0A7J6W0S4_THATH|nr:Fip1 [Thalictrum thalictroides]